MNRKINIPERHALAAMCIWEHLTENPDERGDWLPDDGSCAMRQYVLDYVAPLVDTANDIAIDEHGYDDCFDWEFVPAAIKAIDACYARISRLPTPANLADLVVNDGKTPSQLVEEYAASEGYFPYNTGGNCMVLNKDLGEHARIWITIDEDTGIPETFDEPCQAFLYVDDDASGQHYWLKIADKLPLKQITKAIARSVEND